MTNAADTVLDSPYQKTQKVSPPRCRFIGTIGDPDCTAYFKLGEEQHATGHLPDNRVFLPRPEPKEGSLWFMEGSIWKVIARSPDNHVFLRVVQPDARGRLRRTDVSSSGYFSAYTHRGIVPYFPKKG